MTETSPDSASPQAAQPSPFGRPITFLWQEGEVVWHPGSPDDDTYLDAVVRRERLSGLLAGVPSALLLGVTLALLISRNQPDAGVFAVLAGCLISVPYLFYALRPGPWGVWRNHLDKPADGPAEPASRRVVTLSPDGITYETDIATANYRWSAFEDVRRLHGHISLDWTDVRGALLVPIAAFDSDAEADAWCAAAKNALEQSDYGQVGRSKAFLNAHHLDCGKCRQSLRGLRELRCPECGETFGTFRLRLWQSLQYPLWRSVLARLGVHSVPTRRA